MPKPTSYFQGSDDYKEAQSTQAVCYFGSSKFPPILEYRKDVEKNKTTSAYYGRILYPEARGGKWSYEVNQAFWAGLIDCGRPLLLVTDINHYNKPTYTVNEILWLNDNGYIFLPDPTTSCTWAIPPESSKSEREIKDYNNGDGTDSSYSAILFILKSLKTKLENQRAKLSNVSLTLLNFGIRKKDAEICRAALKGFLTLPKSSSTNYIIYCYIGKAYLELNEVDNAQKAYLQAFNFSRTYREKSVDILDIISIGLMNTCRYDEALQSIISASSLRPNNGRYKYMLGNTYWALEDIDNAKKAYLEAFSLLNRPPESVLHKLGQALLLTESYREALSCFEQAYQLAPHNSEYSKQIIKIQLELKKKEKVVTAATESDNFDGNDSNKKFNNR